MKIVINKCYGGYSLSPQACLWLLEHGFDTEDFKCPVQDYFSNLEDQLDELTKWKQLLASGIYNNSSVSVFSPDNKYVLNERPEQRDHPLLVKCIETLGEGANGLYADLKVVTIPDGVDWEINEYDGMETIAEKHRIWG